MASPTSAKSQGTSRAEDRERAMELRLRWVTKRRGRGHWRRHEITSHVRRRTEREHPRRPGRTSGQTDRRVQRALHPNGELRAPHGHSPVDLAPSRWSTAPSRSSPKGIGDWFTPDREGLRRAGAPGETRGLRRARRIRWRGTPRKDQRRRLVASLAPLIGARLRAIMCTAVRASR